MAKFQSTHPVWGATSQPRDCINDTTISIHAPRVGCDATDLLDQSTMEEFQSTHPVWGATFYW